ncbi:MAG: DoxX family protein [Cyanobacteria bacterium J06642_2]
MQANRYIPLVARICLAVIFVQTGLAKVFNFDGTQQQIASAGLPLAGLVTLFTIIFEIGGGTSLILGYKARVGAILLLIFLIPATIVFHNPILDSTQTIQFMKNLAIIGGLLMVVGNGPGPISLDPPRVAGLAPYLEEDA